MSQERFGLFDTPPARGDATMAGLLVGVLLVILAVVFPLSSTQMVEVSAFVPVTDAIIFVGEMIIASLLYAQATIFHSRALNMLASGFVFIALLLVPHALTFPGAFSPTGLFAVGPSGAAWIMIFRRLAFPLVVILYAYLKEAEAAPDGTKARARLFDWLGGAIALAAVFSLLSIGSNDLLPPIFYSRNEAVLSSLRAFNLSQMALLVIAMVTLWGKRTSVLDMWLQVALFGWFTQTIMNIPVHGRFTLGWYALYGVMVFTHLTLLVALMTESNRLYARLALSTSARNREREARMMSMEAVSAAISHEVGQPLAAATLSASAGLNSLNRDPPDVEAAVKSVRDSIEAGYRTFDVLRSVRTTFGQRTGSLSEFSLNDVALEATSLLSREIASQRISLQLLLDQSLPPILANRTQMQRVLVNLLTNAIESFGGTPRRGRRITISTMVPDPANVLLRIRDTGVGIPSADLQRVFEPFYTTKPSGTGLGLSLCSTIIEEQGGRLWASSGDEGGATLHLQLMRNPEPGLAQPETADDA